MTHKILYIQGVTIMGGAHRSLIEMATHLNRKHYEPIIVTSGKGLFTQELDKVGLDYRIVPMGMWRKGKSFPQIPLALYRIYRLIRREKIALLHANTLWDNPYASLPASWRKVPVVCHIRSVPRPDMIKKYFLNKTSRLICVSDYIKRTLNNHETPPVSTIYNGIDLSYAQLEQVSRTVREDLGFSPDDVVVGMISRLDPLKGQEVLIRAAKLVVKQFACARFLIVGEARNQAPGYLEQLKFQVKMAQLEPYFVFKDYSSNIMELTGALDISVLPSLSEGFGRTNLEAMIMKKPVISSNIGGIPEVVEDGVSGYLVWPNDPESLGAKIIDLIGDTDKRRQMGEQGYLRVKKMFNLKQQLYKVERVYERLLGRGYV